MLNKLNKLSNCEKNNIQFDNQITKNTLYKLFIILIVFCSIVTLGYFSYLTIEHTSNNIKNYNKLQNFIGNAELINFEIVNQTSSIGHEVIYKYMCEKSSKELLPCDEIATTTSNITSGICMQTTPYCCNYIKCGYTICCINYMKNSLVQYNVTKFYDILLTLEWSGIKMFHYIQSNESVYLNMVYPMYITSYQIYPKDEFESIVEQYDDVNNSYEGYIYAGIYMAIVPIVLIFGFMLIKKLN